MSQLWSIAAPSRIVAAYLGTPIVSRVWRLFVIEVRPYLYVLQVRAPLQLQFVPMGIRSFTVYIPIGGAMLAAAASCELFRFSVRRAVTMNV